MVKENQTLSKYSGSIQDLNEPQNDIIARRTVELFFSFDIVNSSAYKMINYTGWYKVIISLFNEIQATVMKMMPGAEMWRVLGDEIIFIIPIIENKDFFIYMDRIFKILNDLVYQLKTGDFFDRLEADDNEKLSMKMQNVISLKAAAWVAIVEEKTRKIEQYDNLLERYKLREGYETIEFLGNDIDAGFRIKKETENRRMVISFELAYILSKDTDYLKNLHIITYKSLKGIWQDRLYPVIWYHDPKYANNVQFEDSFFYDEQQENTLTKEYFSNKEIPELTKEMYNDVHKALGKILNDQNLKSKISKIEEIIQNSPNSAIALGHLLESQFYLRLHCVAVCYEKETMKILIMKRSDGRKKYPNKWEFGCAKGTLEKTLSKQIEDEYRDDFGVKIRVVCDSEREDKQPVPLALYEVESEQGKDKGIISLAEIIEPYDVNKFMESSKHSQVRWISKDEIDSFQEEAVEDFKNTLKLAFEKMEKMYGE